MDVSDSCRFCLTNLRIDGRICGSKHLFDTKGDNVASQMLKLGLAINKTRHRSSRLCRKCSTVISRLLRDNTVLQRWKDQETAVETGEGASAPIDKREPTPSETPRQLKESTTSTGLPPVTRVSETEGAAHQAVSWRHQAGQTEPPSLSTIATQLSIQTLKHVRSRGCQTDPNLLNGELGMDSKSLENYYKKHAVRLVTAKQPWVSASVEDERLRPDHQDTDSSTSERASASGDSPSNVCFSSHTDIAFLEDVCVNLGCLLQLFQRCGECRGVCTVTTTGDSRRFSVLGRCRDCRERTTWSSQLSQVTEDQVSPPEPPEFLTASSEPSPNKCFVEVDVTLDSEGEQCVEDNMEEQEEMDKEEEEEEYMDEGAEDCELEDEGDKDVKLDADEEDRGEKTVTKRGRPRKRPRIESFLLLCPDCGVTHTSKKHRCTYRDTYMSCPECNVRCSNEVSFQRHKSCCRGKGYMCKYCLKRFASWDDKTDHEEQSHLTEGLEKEPFTCPECPQRFGRLLERRRHLKEHMKNVCRACSKDFPSRRQLIKHEMSCVSEKPYKCMVCSRAFAQVCQLRYHMRIHTGEQLYKCKHCTRGFNHRAGLRRHVQLQHPPEDQEQPPGHSLVTTETENDKAMTFSSVEADGLDGKT